MPHHDDSPTGRSRRGSTDRALLVVDVQNDFCERGALPVSGAARILPVLNRYIDLFSGLGLPVYFSRDWHPRESAHFVAWGGRWPAHSVRGTPGAAFHPALHVPAGSVVVSKGTGAADDGYSAFEGHDPDAVALAESLASRGIHTLYIGGLATDYCVRASVLDGLRQRFDVILLADAIRGIDARPGDVRAAVAEMQAAGARLARFDEVQREVRTAAAIAGVIRP